MSGSKRLKARFLGGRQHWNINGLPPGHKELGYADVIYQYPPEFRFPYRDEPFDCGMVTFDREEYRPQKVGMSGLTVFFNICYREIYVYILRGYRPRGMDFSIMMTDLLQAPWQLEDWNSHWYWSLDSKRRNLARFEREKLEKYSSYYRLQFQTAEHGPGFSEEFEKSFDNMI